MKGKLVKAFVAALMALCIAACGTDATTPSAESITARSGDAYRILVVDADSAPVEGVTIQLCTDRVCMAVDTDAGGAAVFDLPEGTYEVHVLGVPGGYYADDTVYTTPTTYGDTTIELSRG